MPSRSFAQSLIAQSLVTVDGSTGERSQRLQRGQTVSYSIPPLTESHFEAEPVPLDIKYEDDDLMVVSKPAGMVTHPAKGQEKGTLVNALLARGEKLSSIGGVMRPGIVHRLDKDTSGLLVIAKNDVTHAALTRELKERKLKRRYLALVHGIFKEKSGRIDVPVGRSFKFGGKMAVVGRAAREAVTLYRVVEEFDERFSLLEVELETGRTHQIRVHMAFARHPVVGDPTYGFKRMGDELGLKRQFLHAYRLELTHPRTGQRLSFEDKLPADLQAVLDSLRSEKD